MAEVRVPKPSGLRRKASLNVTFSVKKEKDADYKKVAKVLQKEEKDRTEDDVALISSLPNIVKQVKSRLDKRKQLQEREAETEDSAVVLEEKCRQLADAIRQAQYFVVYSGAGVSTAASIPDYRGSNGIWTRLQQGKDIGEHDLTLAEPTTAHMALFKLYNKGILRHVVSQNCDGLHLRSGLPKKQLSEVHGNMYLEVCTKCNLQFWREFDVTQHTARYAHKTARRCSQCCEPLRDTIVHFGERGSLPWPINWNGACLAAKQADLILCIGSSLKVLKKYPWLWGMDKPVKKRPKLYIVNLQWTPKDYTATLKINGKCDEVMKLVMSYLNLEIPKYDRNADPIFHHATKLHPLEEHTIASQLLVAPRDTKTEPLISPDIDLVKPCDDDLVKLEPLDSDLIKEETMDSDLIKEEPPDTDIKPPLLDIEDIKCEEVKEEEIEVEEFGTVEVVTSQEDIESVVTSQEDTESVQDLVSQRKLEEIVLEIKKEKEIWRPFQAENTSASATGSGEVPSGSPSPSCSVASETEDKPFTLQVDVFDKVYSEITKKILKETNVEYYREMYGGGADGVYGGGADGVYGGGADGEPLDLSLPKDPPECAFCHEHYTSAMFCLFYKRRETRLPPSGPVCYCCDSEEETEPESTTPSNDRRPTNPGWFGKGYRKRLKKKR